MAVKDINASILRHSTVVFMPDENHTNFDKRVEAIDLPIDTTICELLLTFGNSGNANETNVYFEIRKPTTNS